MQHSENDKRAGRNANARGGADDSHKPRATKRRNAIRRRADARAPANVQAAFWLVVLSLLTTLATAIPQIADVLMKKHYSTMPK